MYKVFLDNSVITKLKPDNVNSNNKFIDLIYEKLEKYKVSEVLLTDKLFLEIIGEGKIREKMLKKNKCFEEKKLEVLLNTRAERKKEAIEEYIDFLKIFFDTKLREELLTTNLISDTEKVLKKYPFDQKFTFIAREIFEMAKDLSNYSEKYN